MHASHTKTEPPAAAGVPSLPPPTIPVPVSHPDLTDEDKERIETWFEHDSRLTEVAQTLGIGVLTLAAWAKQPHIKDALNDIREIAHFRTETLRAEAEHASVNRLLSLVRYSNHEEIARRAAANILGQGLRPGRAAATGLPPNAPSSPPPRDPPARRDDTPSIPTPRVPTPPLPRNDAAPQINAPTLPSPPPVSQPATEACTSSPFPVPVPPPAPPPCLSVSVPPCHLPSTPLLPSASPSPPRSPQLGDNTSSSPPFPVPVPRPAPSDLARQYQERNHTRPP